MVNLLEAYIPNTWLNNEIKLISIDNTIKIPSASQERNKQLSIFVI